MTITDAKLLGTMLARVVLLLFGAKITASAETLEAAITGVLMLVAPMIQSFVERKNLLRTPPPTDPKE